MKKSIFLSIAALSGFASFAQQKPTNAPPPPPKVNLEKFAPPPPPKPPANPKKSTASSGSADYKEFLKRNPTVKSVGWSDENRVSIYLKSGAIEKYDLKKENDMQTAKNKYGELPIAPPQPPKPMVKKFAPPVIKAE